MRWRESPESTTYHLAYTCKRAAELTIADASPLTAPRKESTDGGLAPGAEWVDSNRLIQVERRGRPGNPNSDAQSAGDLAPNGRSE